MMIKFLFVFLPITTAIVLECQFEIYNFKGITDAYTCVLQNDLQFDSPGQTITEVTGNHPPDKSNADVTLFFSSHHKITHFPRDLLNFFPNLNGIILMNSQLSEIHQVDLQSYTKLKFLAIMRNKINKIEKDLFKYNPELEGIGFKDNNITFVDPNVFDHLNKLDKIYISGCVNASDENDLTIKGIIDKIKLQCSAEEN